MFCSNLFLPDPAAQAKLAARIHLQGIDQAALNEAALNEAALNEAALNEAALT